MRIATGVRAESTAQIQAMTGSRLRGDTPRRRRSRAAACEVEHELREESGGVDRQVARGWMRLAGCDQNEGRAEQRATS